VTADEAGYLDTARGDALTRYAASEYGVERHGTTSSVVPLTLSRTAPAPEVVIAPGSVFATEDGVRFATDAEVFWADGDATDKVVMATSVGVGPDMNVASGTITVIESALDDATITVTNAEPAAGGNVEEKDEDLVARLRDDAARKVRGTTEAIRLGCLEVDAVREASVFEGEDGTGVPTGGVTIVVSDETGNGNAAMTGEIETILKEWRPAGCYAEVIAATPVLESIAVTATWDPGCATLGNRNLLIAATVARVNKLDPRASSGTPETSCLLTHDVILEVRPLIQGLRKIQVTTPAGTVQPAHGKVIRTNTGLVTVS
jgi:uncharacterized phage protein gp47/JayE